jgi:hypothetical protein
MLPGVYNNDVQFVQTPKFIVIYNEMIYDARVVPMDGRPHDGPPRWMGDSRGRWDGQTLYACHEGDAPSLEGLLRAARVGERVRGR